MADHTWLAMLLIGFLNAGHCVGMCGGIVAAVSMQLPGEGSKPLFHLAYNLGRILSYGLAGALAGGIGASTFFLDSVLPVQKILFALASLMLLLMGLYLAGIWSAVTRIERLGGALWLRLQPFSKRLLPVRTPAQALGLGLLWGWLPCGLVYSVLVTALASGNPVSGALTLLVFGLGTLPNLLAMGFFARQVQAFARAPWARRGAGLLVAGYGVWGLLRLLS